MKISTKLTGIGLFSILSISTWADQPVIQDGYVLADNSYLPKGIRAEANNIGYGVALKWHAGPYLTLALGYNEGHYAWQNHLSLNGVKYEQDTQTTLRYLNAEIRPWAKHDNAWLEAAYVAVGIGYINQYQDLTQYQQNGTIQLNGRTYASAQNVSAHVEHRHHLSPYIGFGFTPRLSPYWSLVTEFGAYYLNQPNVTMNTGADVMVNLQDLRTEATNIANKSQYSWLPVAKIGIQFDW